MKLNLPSTVTAGLSLVAGVLATLNQFVFHVGSNWYSAVTIALIFLAGLGISPLFGQAWEAKFKSLFHINSSLSLVISSAIGALAIAVTTFNFDSTIKSIIVVVLTVAAGLGFAPATTPAPMPAPPAPVPIPTPAPKPVS